MAPPPGRRWLGGIVVDGAQLGGATYNFTGSGLVYLSLTEPKPIQMRFRYEPRWLGEQLPLDLIHVEAAAPGVESVQPRAVESFRRR
jgi:hypothetical protein